MAAPSTDIKDILEAEGIGTMGAVTGWGIYIGEFPAQPTNVVALFDTVVRQPSFSINRTHEDVCTSSGLVEYPGLQIRCRASEYESAYQKARDVQCVLANRKPFFSADGQFRYLTIYQQSGFLPIGEDDKTRHIFAVNFMAVRTPKQES
jgi:hypothetical protein